MLYFMVYAPVDSAERHRYIEKSIETTLAELRTPEILRQLGARAVIFEQLLNAAVVTNVRHGVISLPEGYDYDACPMPIAAYADGDKLELSGDFNNQTPAQSDATIEVFKKWKPRAKSARSFYEFYHRRNRSDTHTPVSFGAQTESQVGAAATLIPESYQREWFTGAPNKGIALVKQRPVMMLKQGSDNASASPSTVAHELTHVYQAIREPVVLIHSQKSADMHSLREELEAYHYGFPFSAKELLEVGTENIQESSTLVQISVEWTRRHNELDPTDPFRPSPFILKKLQEKHVGSIIHGSIDYENLEALADSCSTLPE